jgi:hypothetical protein
MTVRMNWDSLPTNLAGGRGLSTSPIRNPRQAVTGGAATPPVRTSGHNGLHLTARGKAVIVAVLAGVVVGFASTFWLIPAAEKNWAATRQACEQGLRADVNCQLVGGGR